MHGSNRLGGNSLSDLLVFGKRAGESAASYVAGLSARPRLSDADLVAAEQEALAPFERPGGENPYAVMRDLQESCRPRRNHPQGRRARAGRSRRSTVEGARGEGVGAGTGRATTRVGTRRSTCGRC